VSVRVKYRGGTIGQTSSGAAEYSVLGSFASSRASCMMRLTAMRCDKSISLRGATSRVDADLTRVVLV